jgi:hypothetical protein
MGPDYLEKRLMLYVVSGFSVLKCTAANKESSLKRDGNVDLVESFLSTRSNVLPVRTREG